MKAADLDYLRNINTTAGRAGRSIDPTKPGPDADRIAELRQKIAWLDWGNPRTLEVGLPSHVRQKRLNEARAELARLYNEQPRDKTEEWDHEHAKSRVIVQDENGRFEAVDKVPSPAPSPEPQDVRGKIAQLLLQASAKCSPWLVGPAQWHELGAPHQTLYQTQADAILSAFPALAQSDAQPVKPSPDAGLVKAAEWHQLRSHDPATSRAEWHAQCAVDLRTLAMMRKSVGDFSSEERDILDQARQRNPRAPSAATGWRGDAFARVLASLVAAVSLLKNGGKKAAGSNKIFDQMIRDYEATIEQGRATLAQSDAQPVGWRYRNPTGASRKWHLTDDRLLGQFYTNTPDFECEPLYTAPHRPDGSGLIEAAEWLADESHYELLSPECRKVARDLYASFCERFGLDSDRSAK